MNLHAGMCIHAVQPTIYISVKLTDNSIWQLLWVSEVS